MVKRDAIRSLAQLRQRKKELQLEQEITKREMAHSLGIVRTDLQSYLVKRFALPVGGSVLGLYLLKKFVLGRRSTEAEASEEATMAARAASARGTSALDIAKIIKIAVPIIQTGIGFFAGQFKDEVEEEGEE